MKWEACVHKGKRKREINHDTRIKKNIKNRFVYFNTASSVDGCDLKAYHLFIACVLSSTGFEAVGDR